MSAARGVLRLSAFGLLILLSLAVAAYAVVVYAYYPLGALLHPDMRATFEANRAAIYAHIFASSVAMALGPFQFSRRLRARFPAVHRWTGRVYLGIGVLVGGMAGLYMAFHAFGGVPARLGFGCLALAWLASGWLAYRAAVARDLVSHRRWMVRNFALTFAAVTLRIWLPISLASGIPAEVGYPIIAWLCWVPNLLVAELLFNRTWSNGS